MRKLMLVLLAALASVLGAAAPGLGRCCAGRRPRRDQGGPRRRPDLDDLEAQGFAGMNAAERVSVVVVQTVPATPLRLRTLENAVGSFDTTHRFTVTNGFAAELTKAQIEILSWLPSTVHIEENSVLSAANDTARQSFGVADAPPQPASTATATVALRATRRATSSRP